VPQTAVKALVSRHLTKAVVLLFVALLFACGSSATATPASTGGGDTPSATSGPSPTAAPTAVPQATDAAPAMVGPAGTIHMGQKETGIFEAHPSMSSSPRIQFTSSSVAEGLITTAPDLSASPMLAKSWEISDDFLTWTWKFQEGVQFHKGYGEMTAEDVLYSYIQWNAGAKHARAGIMGDYFGGEDGTFGGREGASSEIVDDHTLVLNTGVPWVPVQVFEFLRNGGGSSSWVVSKKQSEEVGIEVASKDIAATGPWQIESSESGVSWKMSAVEDHWRQTPHFAELIYWTIPEESARVAGFQTGTLDSFDMAFDSLATVEAVDGSEVIGWPNAGQAGLNFYGQTYGLDRDGNEYEFYNPDQAWVSSDPDTDSQAWKDAVNVRKAMNIAIDRQTIVDELLSGFGKPQSVRDWMGHEDRANPDWNYEFNPTLAKEMLADAGFPDGFSITLTPSIRGAPAEVEACEAVAQYWEDIGISVKVQSVPYATIRPELITRKYQGVTCHTVGVRLNPIIGASNYVVKSTFSYGTHHPWMEEHISSALVEVDPAETERKVREVYEWIWDNSTSASLYTHDGIWPVGARLDSDWQPTDYSEVRTAVAFEYVKHR
jgi:peptide/nickel transport system substrate-binding protein